MTGGAEMEFTKEQQLDLDKRMQDYIYAVHMIENFATVNNLDRWELWDLVQEAYDVDCSYAPEEE